MKLLGFIDGDDYVSCGDPLTLVLGQNDSGKTRLLGELLRTLAPRSEDRWADPNLPIVFLELSEDEKRYLFDGTREANGALEVEDGEFGTNFSVVTESREGWDWPSVALEWLAESSSLVLGDSLRSVLRELEISSLFAFQPNTNTWTVDEPPLRAFSVYWCVDRESWGSLESEGGVKNAWSTAEDGFALLNPAPAHKLLSGSTYPEPIIEPPAIDEISDPTGTLPKPIVEIGVLNSVSQVLPIVVPVQSGTLEHLVESAVERMEEYWFRVYDPEAGRSPAGSEAAWLESAPDDSDGIVERPVQIRPEAVSAVREINREVNDQLPAFVSRKYEVCIRIRPIYEWDQFGRIGIYLRGVEGKPLIREYDPASDSTFVTELFPHSQLADGYKLWFQVAVLRGVQIASRRASEVVESTKNPYDKIFDFLGIDLYLLDEPERHLHAGLQRQAAKWLRELLEETGEQALIVSHSPAFISELSESDSLVYVSDGSARNISRVELEAAHEPARDLGLTRGELLTLVRCLLVVEGLTDQAVLEALFGDQLRRAGVQVVPIHGHYRTSTAVIDIGALLLRFTDAEVAVWLDAVPDGFVKDLVAAPDQAGELRANAPTAEAASVASLVELAPRHAVRVEPIANPAPDILFLLDEDAVRRVFPDYPGHRGAQIVKEDKNSSERSSEWFRRLLGKEKAPGAYVDIANEMIRSSAAPDPALTHVVDRCSELAGSIDDRPEWLPID